MRATVLSAIGLLMILAGCSILSPDPSEPAVIERIEQTDSTETVRLQAGEHIQLTLVDARLGFVEKRDDSRCPINVTCIWEGRVTARLAFMPEGGETTTIDLTGYVGPNGDGRVEGVAATDGIEITLLRLDPYPVDGEDPQDADVVTLLIARR